ncbi:MAG: biotin--[acetyl-CoA-carboxylase] ligase [Acidobacteria bacterium]|nr:MAG: biotin--[acetyl-CoA-carboxylase] ligase [Acidobacteriota bacterium]
MRFADYTRELLQRHAELGTALVILARIGSTNDLARRIAYDYAREGNCVPAADLVAWSQTRGRGRGDRRWASAPGQGAYVSLIRPLAAAADAAPLPLQVAVGLCLALNRHLAGRCRLKWPNDLVVEGRKLGGILIETVVHGGCASAVVGFGVNYGRELPASVPHATSLSYETTILPSLAELTCDLIAGVDARLAAGDALPAYRQLSVHRQGDRLCCRVGDRLHEGRFLGFDPHGFLRLEVGGREERLSSGEVTSDD